MDCAAPLWKLLPWKGFNKWLAGMIKKSAARLGSIFIIEPASTGSCEIETIGASVKFFKVLKPGQTCSKKKSQELLQNSASSCIHRAVLAPSLFRRCTKTPKDLEDRVLTKTASAEFNSPKSQAEDPDYLAISWKQNLRWNRHEKSVWNRTGPISPIRYEMLKVPQQLPFLQQYSPTTKYLLAWHTSTDSAHYCVAWLWSSQLSLLVQPDSTGLWAFYDPEVSLALCTTESLPARIQEENLKSTQRVARNVWQFDCCSNSNCQVPLIPLIACDLSLQSSWVYARNGTLSI